MEEIKICKLGAEHYYIQEKLLQTGEVPIVVKTLQKIVTGVGSSDRNGRNEFGALDQTPAYKREVTLLPGTRLYALSCLRR